MGRKDDNSIPLKSLTTKHYTFIGKRQHMQQIRYCFKLQGTYCFCTLPSLVIIQVKNMYLDSQAVNGKHKNIKKKKTMLNN